MMSSQYSDILYICLPIFMPLIFFSDLIFSANGSMIRLNKSPEAGHPCFVPQCKMKGFEMMLLVLIESMCPFE